jgi:tripartite-type tricarboxylate transporter receptor subunit TctC
MRIEGKVMNRKIVYAVLMTAIAFDWCNDAAQAQDFPTRPLTMVVPFTAGGASDVIGRIVAEGLRSELGQAVMVENVGGAGGMTGTNRVAKAAPDGYQFVLGNVGTHAQNQSLYKRPLYNAAADFAPVVLVTDQSIVLAARNDFPANNLQEFIAYAKANQAKVQYGSAGVGGSNHLACVLLNAAIGIDVTHVPYRSGALAMQDLIAGRIDYQCPSLPVALPQIAGKTIKALAILTKNRSAILPALASAHEQGLVNFDVPSWYAIFLPKGTPAAIIQKLHDATVAAMETPSVHERLEEIGADVVPPERRSSDYLGKFVASEIEKWAIAVKASGVQAD